MNGLTWLIGSLVAVGIWVGTIQMSVVENTKGRAMVVQDAKETKETVIRMDERQKQILEILKKLEKDRDAR